MFISGTALLSINGCTPYNAVYGRTPALLPGLKVLNDDGEILPLTDRQVGRVREISVQSIVEGTAHNKLVRAINTRTLPAGETYDYKVGEEIEFFRDKGAKDVSGWIGPATITNIGEINHGVIKAKHRGSEMTIKLGASRRYLEYFTFS